ncbi:glycosyltransferase family 2 protein [Priestia megaterium]|uniref:glycosyltransferase family 2 protein n=1 Tax=Priestia megaterium TaxID=1404 RepID=UPI00189E1FC9|nr:glycosyltransferase family 2 protein [Priestia megaterium]
MSDNGPLVSIVIPTYNRGDTLVKTINSVFSQSYTNYEVIIVDDASTDKTEKIVREIKDPRLKYIKLNQNSKGTRPRNVGIQSSSGDYIALLDSDDEWLPEKLEKQIGCVINSKLPINNIMCFTGVIIKNENSEKSRRNSLIDKDKDIMEYIFIDGNVVQTSTFLISSTLAKNTLFDPTIKKHQDWDFCLRLRENNANFLALTECLTIWHDEENRKGRISNDSNYKNSTFWFNKNKSKLGRKVQYAFTANVLINDIIDNKKKKEALMISLKAFFHKGIKLKGLLKNLVKIYFSKREISKIKKIQLNYQILKIFNRKR